MEIVGVILSVFLVNLLAIFWYNRRKGLKLDPVMCRDCSYWVTNGGKSFWWGRCHGPVPAASYFEVLGGHNAENCPSFTSTENHG